MRGKRFSSSGLPFTVSLTLRTEIYNRHKIGAQASTFFIEKPSPDVTFKIFIKKFTNYHDSVNCKKQACSRIERDLKARQCAADESWSSWRVEFRSLTWKCDLLLARTCKDAVPQCDACQSTAQPKLNWSQACLLPSCRKWVSNPLRWH